MRIGLLNNLRVGKNARSVYRLLDSIEPHHDVAHVETSSLGMVPEALAELAGQGVDVLAVNGGDGTLQHVLTEILAHRAFGDRVPVIAPLRGGRTNMTALHLGAARDPVRGFASLQGAVKNGLLYHAVERRHALRVEIGPERSVCYGMFFGSGIFQRAMHLTHRVFPDGRSQGVIGGTLVTAALVVRGALGRDTSGILTPDKLDIRLDGEPIDGGEYYFAMATVLPKLFARMRPFWGSEPHPVRFTSLRSDARRLGREAFGILTGRPGRNVREENGYVSRNVRRIDLQLDCGISIDGELQDPKPGRTVTIERSEEEVLFARA